MIIVLFYELRLSGALMMVYSGENGKLLFVTKAIFPCVENDLMGRLEFMNLRDKKYLGQSSQV